MLKTRYCKKKHERAAIRIRQLEFKEENGEIHPDEIIELVRLKEQLEAFEKIIKPSERNKSKPKYNRPRMA